VLQQEDPFWLSPEAGLTSWTELKRLSLSQAVLDLRARLGDDVDTWQWGRMHQVSFDHPLGRVKPLNLIFNRGPYPIGGDGDTPHQSSGEGGTYAASGFLPSYRQIVDLGDLKNSWSVHTTGQSGLPGDPHYDDFIPLWREGRYHRMLFDRRQILNDLEHLLVLRPQ
jgi:penicillin amidase